MPGLNQTGPLGRGPMTGRGRGLCVSPRASFEPGFGRGRRLGRGFGRGFGPGYFTENLPHQVNYQAGNPQFQTQDISAEMDRLQGQAESIQHSLDAISKRLGEMEKSK